MKSRQQFSPLCDLHHTPMKRRMIEENSAEIRSFHACERRDCTRVFRDAFGYSDMIDGSFEDSRSSRKRCPTCASILYLAEVDHGKKIETWECTQSDCAYSEEDRSPSAQ